MAEGGKEMRDREGKKGEKGWCGRGREVVGERGGRKGEAVGWCGRMRERKEMRKGVGERREDEEGIGDGGKERR